MRLVCMFALDRISMERCVVLLIFLFVHFSSKWILRGVKRKVVTSNKRVVFLSVGIPKTAKSTARIPKIPKMEREVITNPSRLEG